MLRIPSAKMRQVTAALLSGMAVLLASVEGQAQTAVRFSLDGRWEGTAAPFAVAQEKGYFKAEGLDVTIEPAAGSREALMRIASGAVEAGIADVNGLVRLQNDKPDADAIAVMMLHDRPAFAIVGRKSRGLSTDLSSLQGKTFGAPQADVAYAMWPVFRAVNKIDDSSMKFENVGLPVREPMLAQGEVDAVFGLSTTSFINLKSRGVPTEDIVTILMSDHGLDAYGSAILVSKKFAQENPDAVRGLLRAVVRGLQDAAKDPSNAVDAVLARNDLAKKDVELDRLRMALEQNILTPWVREHGVGGIDQERFVRALDQISSSLEYKEKPKSETVFTDAFLPPADQRKIER
ncbi:ABC transporter substrate-binding protein [Microvirga rosea]|uniref:ABC transporter substrate-binding protein n=1 Tax=Microvirga rosea TaxID=2715425 RepID=UPI001D0B1904|nr:ABC transporter substrate-binding protein [Microvirga rosea]MCB8818970.1 ABC transporter substrate-binding protein [Microvirga rosea]